MTAGAKAIWWSAQQRLLAESLDEVDGDAVLNQAALAGPCGRRLLAGRLAANQRFSQLMGYPTTAQQKAVFECRWLQWPGEQLTAMVTDLGALALSPGFKQLIDRRSVNAARDQLGAARFRLAMSVEDPWCGDVGAVIVKSAKRLIRDSLSAGELLPCCLQTGLREIRCEYPSGMPAARLKALFGKVERNVHELGWLPRGVAGAFLERSGVSA